MIYSPSSLCYCKLGKWKRRNRRKKEELEGKNLYFGVCIEFALLLEVEINATCREIMG